MCRRRPCHADVIATRNFATTANPRFRPKLSLFLRPGGTNPKDLMIVGYPNQTVYVWVSEFLGMKRFPTLFLLKV
jgi:hypothetical protein